MEMDSQRASMAWKKRGFEPGILEQLSSSERTKSATGSGPGSRVFIAGYDFAYEGTA